jgi:prevent-host-death family protein
MSDFKRNTPKLMAKMKKSGRPLVLTVKGKAEAVIQDAASYEKMRDLAERAEMLQFLAESQADADAGRTQPAIEALEHFDFHSGRYPEFRK